jgi:beta-galactosidase
MQDFNSGWRFLLDSNASDFRSLSDGACPLNVIGDLSCDPKWGTPSRLFNQCPTEGWLSGNSFSFPADIHIELGCQKEIAGFRVHFFDRNSPLDYEVYLAEDPAAIVPEVTASSEETRSGNFAKNAVDGDAESRWCAQGGAVNEWLLLDYGRDVRMAGLNIMWEKDVPYGYRVEISKDRNSWNPVAVAAMSDKKLSSRSVRHDFSGEARYVRITVTGLQPGTWASVCEVSLVRGQPHSEPVFRGEFSTETCQVVSFSPQPVRQFRLRLLSGRSDNACWIGELELLSGDELARALSLQKEEPSAAVDWTGARARDFDDSAWRPVDLPHDWSIEQPFNAGNAAGRNSAYLPGGLGFYRKTFFVPREWAAKKVMLTFGGIYMNSSVYCNGVLVGGRNYGYSTFGVDLTPHLEFGKENVVAVRVDNREQPNSRWYTGSGIYRDVTLQVSDPVHVKQWGVFVTVPHVDGAAARVEVETDVMNETGEGCAVSVRQEIRSPEGAVVAESLAEASLTAMGGKKLKQTLEVIRPERWSPEKPHLYQLVTTVTDSDGRLDRVETPFGIRTIEYGPEFGFKLNGKKTLMKGVCLHHELGSVGAAEFHRALDRRLTELKKLGVNAIRTSHNPYSEYFMKRCDELGFLVIGEMYDKWTTGNRFFDESGNTVPWQETWSRDLAYFVRRDRNHPSLVMWSVGNEVHEQQHSEDGGIGIFQALRERIREFDVTRPVSAGLFPRMDPGNEPPRMAKAMDVVGTNYLEKHWDSWRKNHPGMSFYASEMTTYNWGENWYAWDKSKGVGQFYWGGTDYLGEGRFWPNIGWYRGLIDLTGFIKDGAYYVKSFYHPEPMVHIVVKDDQAGEESVVWNAVQLTKDERRSHWNWEGRKEVQLYTYTNCEEVELFLNDRSLGVRPVRAGDNNMLVWDVPFEPGVLKAVARKQGRPVAEHVLKTAGVPARIVLSPERDTIGADRDLGYINVSIVDENGTVVPDAANRIRFEVAGAGENFAVSSADVYSAAAFRGDARDAFQGRAQLTVRSLKQGTITVRAFSDGLEPATATLNADDMSSAGMLKNFPESYTLPGAMLAGKSEKICYKQTPQGDLYLFLLRPTVVHEDPLPAIIYFHGGSWKGGDVASQIPTAAWFRDHGMIGITASYRLESKHGTSPLECIADAKSAVRYVRAHAKQLGIDPDRIVVAGGSAGGHMAVCTLLPRGDSPEDDLTVSARPDALVLHNPVLGEGFGAFFFKDHPEFAPILHVEKGWPPTILSNGTKDNAALYSTAEKFTRQMSSLGNTCELITVEGAGHSCDWPVSNPNFRPTLQRMTEFLREQGMLE